MDWLLWIAGVLIFLFILMVSVGLHEAGHMVAAKKLGVQVPEFFIGFGTKLWSFKRKGTEYGVRLIPAGGYVRLVDENVEKGNPQRELLSRIDPWRRQIIFAAGPVVNLVLGFALIFGVLLAYPYQQPSTSVDTVNSCSSSEVACGAKASGILPGDKVVSIGGKEIKDSTEMAPALKGKKTVDIEVIRDGKNLSFPAVAIADNRFGVNLTWEFIHRTPGEAVDSTVGLVVQSFKSIISIPGQIPGIVETVFQGAERDPESIGSVVGAGRTYGDVAATDKLDVDGKIRTFLLIAGGLNLSLGFLNFLPIGILDGAKMLFAFFDSVRKFTAKIKKKEYTPTPYSFVKWVTAVPTLVLVALMALLIAADIVAPISIF